MGAIARHLPIRAFAPYITFQEAIVLRCVALSRVSGIVDSIALQLSM